MNAAEQAEWNQLDDQQPEIAVGADFDEEDQLDAQGVLGLTGTIFKVVFMLSCETMLFPVACGVMMDWALLPALDASVADRREFLDNSPLLFVFAHWLLGFGFMLLMACCHNYMTATLRQEVVPFARELNAAHEAANNGDFWAPLLAVRVSDFVLSCAAYAPLVLCLVWVPTQLNLVLCPWIFPLSVSPQSSTFGFPAELVAFHIVLPLVLEYQDIRVQLTGLVTFGLHLIAELLGISAYLFPEDADLLPEDPAERPRFVGIRIALFFIGTKRLQCGLQ